jgi:hypothetical protein
MNQSWAKHPSLRGRIRSGLVWGAGFAAVYSAYVILVGILNGGEPFEAAGTSLARVVGVYWLGGLLGGTVFGLALPLTRTRGGAAVVGVLAAFPVWCAIGLAVEPVSGWFTTVPANAALLALVAGPTCGLALWYVNRHFHRMLPGGRE